MICVKWGPQRARRDNTGMTASDELPMIAAPGRMNVAEERQGKTFQHVCVS